MAEEAVRSASRLEEGCFCLLPCRCLMARLLGKTALIWHPDRLHPALGRLYSATGVFGVGKVVWPCSDNACRPIMDHEKELPQLP